MKTFKIVTVVIAVLMGAVVGAGMVLRADWEVRRSVFVAAAPASVRARVLSLRTWQDWAAAPAAADPEVRWEFSDVDGQVGSYIGWRRPGMQLARMIIADHDGNRVRLDEQLTKDSGEVQKTGESLFIIEPDAGGSRVSWRKTGPAPRVLGSLLNPLLEKQVAPQIDDALLRLKQVMEAGA